MLLLQWLHEKERQKVEIEKPKLELDQQVITVIEHLRRETEQTKIALQTARLGLAKENKLSGDYLKEEKSQFFAIMISSFCYLPAPLAYI